MASPWIIRRTWSEHWKVKLCNTYTHTHTHTHTHTISHIYTHTHTRTLTGQVERLKVIFNEATSALTDDVSEVSQFCVSLECCLRHNQRGNTTRFAIPPPSPWLWLPWISPWLHREVEFLGRQEGLLELPE